MYHRCRHFNLLIGKPTSDWPLASDIHKRLTRLEVFIINQSITTSIKESLMYQLVSRPTFQNNSEVARYPIQISLDIHDDSTRLFSVDMSTGSLKADSNIIGSYKQVSRAIHRFCSPNEAMIIYEAGPCGFAPFRYFAKKGYCVKVVAPSSIPQRGGDQKTDRNDAIHNLYYHTSGLLRYVTVPSYEDEDARECLRYRQQTVWSIGREKQKIQCMMKRHGQIFTLTKSSWTCKHYHWLRTIELGLGARSVLDGRLSTLVELEERLEELDENLNGIMENNPRYRRLMKYYQMLAGVGRVTAMTFIIEGGDFNRFGHPKAVMKFIGLIPGKRSSGRSDLALHITKAGNKYLRTAFVCAAKYYGDRRFLRKKRLKDLPDEIKCFIEQYQNRLYSRYSHLRKKGKKANVAKVAIARELCGFVWSFVVNVLPMIKDTDIPSEAA